MHKINAVLKSKGFQNRVCLQSEILSKSAGSYIFNVNKESDKKSRASDKRFTQSDALLYCLKTHLNYF
jgi:hypothetical protein